MPKIDYRCLCCGFAQQMDVPVGPAPVGSCPSCGTAIEPTAQLDEAVAPEAALDIKDPMVPARPVGPWGAHGHGKDRE